MGSAKGDKYDLAESDLKSFTRSSIRTKVMLTLLSGSKTAREMAGIIDTRETTILHSMSDLFEGDLVEKKQQEYNLTSLGKIQAILLDELVNTIATIREHPDFWLQHDISGIPADLQKRIGMLGQGEIIRDTLETPLKSLDYFIETLSLSKEIFGVSPVVVRGYPEAISHIVNNGAHVELILTNAVLKVVIAERKEILNKLLEGSNFKLFSIDQDVKLAFTVTDSFLNLGLSRIDGSYDLGTDLIYSGDTAIEWGKMLYRHYRSLSNQLEYV